MFIRLFALAMIFSSIATASEQRLFIGTYSRGDSISEGIYTCLFDTNSGQLSPPTLAAKADNPSFLAVHPSQNFLFACIETNDFDGNPTGAVSAFQVDRTTGKLTLINQQPTGGGAPCHCTIDATGRFLLVANYSGGNAAVFPISEDGSLAERSCMINHIGSGPDKGRQEAPHAHSINLSADNRFAYVADLGIDRIMIYRFDAQDGLLVPSAVDSASVATGSGPRHFSIHPSGKFAFTNHELTGEATAFLRDATSGGLTAIQTISTLPDNFTGRKSTAECLVHPNGNFLYVSNRGHDSIAVYEIDQNNGTLKTIEISKTGGQEPRNFFITDDGKWLIAENQNSDSIVVFAVEQNSGRLTQQKSQITVGKPVCIRAIK